MNKQSTTDTRPNLTTTNIAALTDEQREGLETLLNGRGMGWTVRITEQKVTYLKGGEEVFSLWSHVSSCERVICHWNGTTGDDLDQRAMDAVVRCRKLSPAMKATIETAFDNAFVSDAIVKTGKTFIDAYAWGAEMAVAQLCEDHPNWEESEVEGMADSVLFQNREFSVRYEITDARVAFVAESIRATRAASEARVLEALATLRTKGPE